MHLLQINHRCSLHQKVAEKQTQKVQTMPANMLAEHKEAHKHIFDKTKRAVFAALFVFYFNFNNSWSISFFTISLARLSVSALDGCSDILIVSSISFLRRST